jgi:hypothetical protein
LAKTDDEKLQMMKNSWLRIGFNAWNLSFEASSVIGLRVLKIAAGGAAAEAETRLMFREKIEAGWTIQGKALTGALGLTTHTATARMLSHYRRKVRANQRRLVKCQRPHSARPNSSRWQVGIVVPRAEGINSCQFGGTSVIATPLSGQSSTHKELKTCQIPVSNAIQIAPPADTPREIRRRAPRFGCPWPPPLSSC